MITIRAAQPGDQAALFELVRALACFEKLESTVTGSAEALGDHLFGDHPSAEALLAEEWVENRVEDRVENGAEGRVAGGAPRPVAFALFYTTYSTFLTRPGIHLEDLFVLEGHRRRGVGRALLAEVRRIAEARRAGRLEWTVLDWNAAAIAFYRGLGAEVLPDWRICRLMLPAAPPR